MNIEALVIIYPIAHHVKFVEIQEADENLDAMFEVVQTTKNTSYNSNL